MHPTLLPWLRVPSYGFMLVLAAGAGWYLARRRAARYGLAAWHVDWLIPLLLLASGVGGRAGGAGCGAYFQAGGNDRTLYGALLAGVVTAGVYGRLLGIPLGRLADTFAASLPAAIGLLRVGCFLAGCCWGDLCIAPERLAAVPDAGWRHQVQTLPRCCPEGFAGAVRFPEGSPAYVQHRAAGLLPAGGPRSLPVHPVQLYEALAAGAVLGLLLVFQRQPRRSGESFLLVAMAYPLARFGIEVFRADQPLFVGGWTLAQTCCLPLAVLAALVWTYRARRLPQRPW